MLKITNDGKEKHQSFSCLWRKDSIETDFSFGIHVNGFGADYKQCKDNALKAVEGAISQLESVKAELQAPKNKCGSCKHFRYFSDSVLGNNGLANGACIEGLGIALRDSQDSACDSYDRKLSKGAVEEWEVDF